MSSRRPPPYIVSRPHFWPYFFRRFSSVLIAIALIFLLHDAWPLRRIQTANLDSWLASAQATISPMIVLVTIDDTDYSSLFHGHSPLDQDVVLRLLNAIAAAGPKVIAVDIDTSQWSRNGHPSLTNERCAIIWASDAIEHDGKLVPLGVLGGSEADTCAGIPSLFQDEDGIVRNYERSTQDSAGGRHSSFSYLVAHAFRGGAGPCRSRDIIAPTDALRPVFAVPSHTFHRLSSRALLQLAAVDTWRQNNPLIGKVALLAGTYRFARDKYITPRGLMDGAEILAHSIDVELSGKTPRTASRSVLILVDSGIGLLLIVISFAVRKPWVPFAILLFTPALSLYLSWTLFDTFGYFLSFVPVLIVLFGHEVLDWLRDQHDLTVENEELRRKLEAAKLSSQQS